MEIFFQDPSEIPLPPEEVRIRELRADPWPDGRRVRIVLEVDPSQKRPSAEVQIVDAEGDEVARASIIESMSRKMEINLHLRQQNPQGKFRLSAALFFSPPLPESKGQETENLALELPEPMVVDRAEIDFEIPASGDGN
jgi:hypothetical protein